MNLTFLLVETTVHTGAPKINEKQKNEQFDLLGLSVGAFYVSQVW
jgi:hypothetical protein